MQAELLKEALGKKLTRPSHRREMDGKAVAVHGVSIALACRTFDVSGTCYRYQAKLNGERTNRSPICWSV